MDIADFIRSVSTFDLLVVFVLFAMFIAGFIQGTIRRLLGIVSILFSFLVAANLREPLGNFLAGEWTHLERPYAIMLGFLTIFLIGSIGFAIVVQAFYKKMQLFEKYTFVDEVIGGTLGVIQGVLILLAIIVILDTGFENPGMSDVNELPFLRELHAAYDPSVTAALFRERIIPAFFAVFGLFVPEAIRAYFPGIRIGTPA